MSALFGYRPGAWSEAAHEERVRLLRLVPPRKEPTAAPKVLACSECSAPFPVLRGEPLTCSLRCSLERKKRMLALRRARLRRGANLPREDA